ncbi:hypothetical protein JXJ21_25555 [candidate division KSB1 bacterium]|nr:hypothetical protein [candidate division KSB1 bacterium]
MIFQNWKYCVLFLALGILLSCAPSIPVNGYRTTIGEGADEITVVVVHGTPYEMGFALGNLLKKEASDCMGYFLKAAQTELPQRFSDEKLDSAWMSVSPYIHQRFKDELRGFADGAKLDLKQLQRTHMIPVMGDYACSGVAVWGEATADGHLYQFRNLDFYKKARLQDYPVIAIYLPSDGIAHAVPTFAGYIAAHTGMNARGIVLGEKGESPESDFPFDLDGTHFTTLFRDLLYDAQSLPELIERVKSTKLIKRYHLYFGDGQPETMGAVKMLVFSPDSVKLTIWQDNDPTDEVAPNVLPYTIYYTMKNDVAFRHLSQNTGSYDSEKMIELSKAVADEGGNLVNIVYDATSLEMWIAYAEKQQDASSRPYIHLKMTDYIK